MDNRGAGVFYHHSSNTDGIFPAQGLSGIGSVVFPVKACHCQGQSDRTNVLRKNGELEYPGNLFFVVLGYMLFQKYKGILDSAFPILHEDFLCRLTNPVHKGQYLQQSELAGDQSLDSQFLS